jgi:transposase
MGTPGLGRQQAAPWSCKLGSRRGTAYVYNVKALRDAEIELARHAEEAYERFVSPWQRRGRSEAAHGRRK